MSEPPEAAENPVARAPVYAALAKVLLGFVPGLVAVDAFVGWLDREETKSGGTSEYYLKDDKLGWKPRPHFENPEFGTRLDRYGLRNPEIPEDADPTEVRVLGVGASRLYGAGSAHQSEIWNTHLSEDFSSGSLAGKVRFLNGGVMGYSTVQSCRRAIELLPEIRPDLVFVMVSPGAQLMLDPSAARQWVRMDDGELVRADVVDGWPEPLWPIALGAHQALLHSHLYTRHRAQFQLDNAERSEAIQRWVLSRAEQPDAVREMLDRTFDELVALRDAANAIGAEVRVLVSPEHYQDDAQRWLGYCRDNRSAGAPPPGTPRSEPTDVLAERCEALGLEYWRLDREVERIGAARDVFMASDKRHWSGAGHRVVASGLKRFMEAEGLLERLAERRAQNPREPKS